MAKKAAKPPVKKSTGGRAEPPSVSFDPVKTELKRLREKLQAILDAEGENLTILDIICKIDKLDRVLVCQVNMTRAF